MGVEADLAGLVRAARGGDDSAYGLVVEACWDDLVRFARSIVGAAEAEDVVQDCLVRAWRDLDRLRNDERFRAWVTTAVYRRCLRWRWWSSWRRQRLVDLPVPSTAPASQAALDVAALLARLTPRQRAVLHLTVIEGMSDAEIAGVLSTTAGTVRAHRRRAKASLQRELERHAS
jgi:RNA polymerase sigma-70 factor (ECF subfamily)